MGESMSFPETPEEYKWIRADTCIQGKTDDRSLFQEGE